MNGRFVLIHVGMAQRQGQDHVLDRTAAVQIMRQWCVIRMTVQVR